MLFQGHLVQLIMMTCIFRFYFNQNLNNSSHAGTKQPNGMSSGMAFRGEKSTIKSEQNMQYLGCWARAKPIQ